ncbi:MAG: hypothetical protein ACI9XO_003417 [Paraglaciecola sp.]|jgi:hypothetical protein
MKKALIFLLIIGWSIIGWAQNSMAIDTTIVDKKSYEPSF